MTKTAAKPTKRRGGALPKDEAAFEFKVHHGLLDFKVNQAIPDEVSEIAWVMEHYKTCLKLCSSCVKCTFATVWVRLKERTPITQGLQLQDVGEFQGALPRSWLAFRCVGETVKRGCTVCAEAATAGKKLEP